MAIYKRYAVSFWKSNHLKSNNSGFYLNIGTELFASYKDTYLLHFAIWIKKIGQKSLIFSSNS